MKTVAEREGILPEQTVFWYNMSLKSGQDEKTVLHVSVDRYAWKHPKVEPGKQEEETRTIDLREVKHFGSRCMT